MSDLFYRPEPEPEEDLLAKLKRLAGYEALPAVSEVPKFEPGEHVKMEDGFHVPLGGDVQGEPYLGLANDGKEEWFYYISVYDQEGPRGMEVWPERDLHRPERYDQPAESTLEDWMDIPPAGEQYYRTASPTMFPFPDRLIQECLYKRMCPSCGGYLEKRGDFYTCQKCPFEYPPNGERTAMAERTGDPTLDRLIEEFGQKTAGEDPWGEMFQPGYVEQNQSPTPFIFSPTEKQIHWGQPGWLHDQIQDDLHRQGRQVPEDAYYGRYFPDAQSGNEIYIYDEPFRKLPWAQQRRIMDLVYLNRPGFQDTLL